ncbi:hypothetical protein ACFOEE_12340 [Pseudoalteromonas fenneropenaei]|uniref:STAS/SEC14 domain-containing protein n=1 Tax=Pseudoalteromonas fenneropenaei TaxID=1737459 RepID=A0ABV7CLI8_9GAMM
MMFAAHGDWRILIVTPCVYIQPIGAFNKEGVLAFQRDAMQQVAGYPAGSLVSAVIDLRRFELNTADSNAVVQEYFAGIKQRGYQRIDYIGANVLAQQVLEILWQGTNMEVHFHRDLDAFLALCPAHQPAKNWLQSSQ